MSDASEYVTPSILTVDTVIRDYTLPRTSLFHPPGTFRAVHGVSFSIKPGSSLGLIGESGSGKSTLARVVVALDTPTSGTVKIGGQDVFAANPDELRKLRQKVQMVFQDPYGSLDPRQKVGTIIAEPLWLMDEKKSAAERRELIGDALVAVGLPAEAMGRYPHEFSGGQRQRIAVARALVTAPDLVVADEPVSALDVSVQAQVLNLLVDLQQNRGVTFLFISHDLSVVQYVTQDVVVLYHGRIVEAGKTADVLTNPRHPYTIALVEAVPKPDPSRRRRPKSVPREPLSDLTSGCPFAPRCVRAKDHCRSERPELASVASGHDVACHYPD